MTGWIGLENEMEPLQFQSTVKIVMVTQSVPGLVGLIGLISPRLDWLLISYLHPRIFGKNFVKVFFSVITMHRIFTHCDMVQENKNDTS